MLRRSLWFVAILLSFYFAVSLITGIWLAEGHCTRNANWSRREPQIRAAFVREFHASFEPVTINTADRGQMKAWYVRPIDWNHASVLLLHGVADNRDGMTGYAAMFLKVGYAVLLPDSRAHGESGGAIATYGVLERDDVGQWSRWLQGESDGCVLPLWRIHGGCNCTPGCSDDTPECAHWQLSPLSHPSVRSLMIASRRRLDSASLGAKLSHGQCWREHFFTSDCVMA